MYVYIELFEFENNAHPVAGLLQPSAGMQVKVTRITTSHY